jgi:prepilin-type N-terminal cleavage/methylation domain-containing protein
MKKRGFTLIELLIVIAIIGILALIVIINISDSRTKAQYAKLQSDVKSISGAMNIVVADGRSGEFGGAYLRAANCRATILSQENIIPGLSGIPTRPAENWPDEYYTVSICNGTYQANGVGESISQSFSSIRTVKNGNPECRARNGNILNGIWYFQNTSDNSDCNP